MLKILFVCHGNICRSPMAEFVTKHKLNLINKNAEIQSKATSDEETGNPVYYAVRPYLDGLNIDYSKKRAQKMTKQDGDYYDFILVMDSNNLRNAKRIIDEKNYFKLYRLCDFTPTPKDLSDPWYTRDFDACYDDVTKGVDGFIEFLIKKNLL